MANLGKLNRLSVVKKLDFGFYLDGQQHGEILLPLRYAPDNLKIGDDIEVFLYNDSEDRIVATTEQPKAMVGECAYLKVISVDQFGAFLDWGLPKDLLLPYSEQHRPVEKGYSYTVFVFVDEQSQRIAASTMLEDHLSIDNFAFQARQPVKLLIYGKSDLGFKAVINGTHLGQLFDSETIHHLHFGESIDGFIKQIRDDGKVDLTLQLPSQLTRNQLTEEIVEYLQQQGGESGLTDKSHPDEIFEAFGVSKSSYKKALGQLYKSRKIIIEKTRIALV
ncbi:MAG: putative RNA-binding protein (virulence factor B family) [Planctomycetota bacterium]|jgi:predicted RNA-binding protein (virulence factor B family)